MSFNKRYITNDKIISYFKRYDIDSIIKMYKGTDAIIAEEGISSIILSILYDKSKLKDPIKIKEEIKEEILKSFVL